MKKSVSVVCVYVGMGFTFTQIPASQALAARCRVVPLRILTGKGEKIYVDKVTDVTRMASTKAGGIGDRYTCIATFGELQKRIFVYRDEEEWFMEDDFAVY